MKPSLPLYSKVIPQLVLGLGSLVLFLLPSVVAAYAPIVPIPGVDYRNLDASQLIETLYILAIALAALIAVGRLVLAGLQYITSDIVTDKETAKQGIRGAVIGLLIILAAVVILRTINSDIANLPELDRPTLPDLPPPLPAAEVVTPPYSPLVGDSFSFDNRTVEEIAEDITLDEDEVIVDVLEYPYSPEGLRERRDFYQKCRETYPGNYKVVTRVPVNNTGLRYAFCITTRG